MSARAVLGSSFIATKRLVPPAKSFAKGRLEQSHSHGRVARDVAPTPVDDRDDRKPSPAGA